MPTSSVSAPLSRSSRIAIAVVAGATALLAGACSSSVEVTPTAATAPDTQVQTTQTDQTQSQAEPAAPAASTPSVNCQELHEARVGIRGVGGNLIYAEDAEFVELLIGGPGAIDELLADVDTLRPHQDVVVAPFGSIREGLDNFVSDLSAATEGRYTDIVGGYSPVAMNGLLAELGC